MSVGPSVLLSVCQLHQFVVKFFSSKSFFSHHFRLLIAILSVFVQFIFNQVDDTVFYESERSIWGHNFVLTKFLFVFFSCSSKPEQRIIGFFFVKNNRQNRHNCLPCVQEGFLKNFFWKVSFFHHFELSDFCLSTRQKFVRPVVGTAFCVSIRAVCGEKILSKFYFLHQLRTLIANWSVFVQIFFRASGRHCILRVQGSIWGHKTVLSKLCLFHLSFAYLERKNQGFFSKKQSKGLSKLLTTCPRWFFEEVFFEKVLF